MFGRKKSSKSDDDTSEQRFLDETFQEELRNHARLYFKEVIKENGDVFKQSLALVIQEVNEELKSHITTQLDASLITVTEEVKSYAKNELDGKFSNAAKVIEDAQQSALKAIDMQSTGLQTQYQQLAQRLEKSVSDQETVLTHSLEENTARISSLRSAQDQALKALNDSAAALESQYKQLSQSITTSVSHQTSMMTKAFEDNMARVIEHYLLTAVGDQFDVKSQLPAIIAQMEANKQAILNDMNA